MNIVRRTVAVVGAGDAIATVCDLAYDVGVAVARRGAMLICGGRAGAVGTAPSLPRSACRRQFSAADQHYRERPCLTYVNIFPLCGNWLRVRFPPCLDFEWTAQHRGWSRCECRFKSVC